MCKRMLERKRERGEVEKRERGSEKEIKKTEIIKETDRDRQNEKGEKE